MIGRKRESPTPSRPDASVTIRRGAPRQSMVFSPLQVCLLAFLCSCLAAAVTHYFSYYTGGVSGYSASLLLAVSQQPERVEESLRRASVTRQRLTGHLPVDNGARELDTHHSSEGKNDESTGKTTAPPRMTLQWRKPKQVFNDDVKQSRPIAETTANNWPEINITKLDPSLVVTRNGNTHPSVAWLMSFPNSGTSFTIHMTREASNCTTASNYALEGEVKNLPSVQAIEGETGQNGPFLELIRNRFTTVPPMILTKTHCTGYCSQCGPYKLLFETPRSFMRGCLTGTRAVKAGGKIRGIDVMYQKSLVVKAIHVLRHPLDNIVARFHLEYNEAKAAGDDAYVQSFPKDSTGFQKWCARSDVNRKLLVSKYIDDDLKRAMTNVPCFNEFHKYVQWHNMAFYTTSDMKLDTLILHYHEYADDFEKTRDKVLAFLDYPNLGTTMEFHSGKVYRHYYTNEQKIAIKAFIEEYSTPDTWEQLKEYDFEIDTYPIATMKKNTQ